MSKSVSQNVPVSDTHSLIPPTEDVNPYKLLTNAFQQLLLKQEETVFMLGTIFSGGLIHNWCSNDYTQQLEVQ